MENNPEDAGKPPEWDPAWNDDLEGYREILVARATFKGTFGKSPDLMQLIETASCFSEVYSIDDWKDLVERYASEGLLGHQVTKESGEDFPARVYFISKALDRLLTLLDAREAFKSDVQLLCSQHLPRGAPAYGRVQDSLIDEIGAGPSTIAKSAKVDRGTVHDLVRRKAVIRPRK